MFLFIDKKFICWTTEWSVRKYVNTSFFQTCNINCGQCVIKLTRRAKGHHWVFSSDSKLADKFHHLVSYHLVHLGTLIVWLEGRSLCENSYMLAVPLWKQFLHKDRNLCRSPCTVITMWHSINWNIQLWKLLQMFSFKN